MTQPLPRSTARSLGLVLVLMVWLHGCDGGQSARIQEQQVEDLLVQLDNAAGRADVSAIGAYLSDDVTIRLTFAPELGGRTLELDKAAYLDRLADSFRATSDYHYERMDTRIEIRESGARAVARVTTHERVRSGGETVRAKGAIELSMGRRGGTLEIIALRGELSPR